MEQRDRRNTVDPSADRAAVLVLVRESQRQHPTLRALRSQSEHTATPRVEVDVADVDQVDADAMCAVTAIGTTATRAARYAIGHDLIHVYPHVHADERPQ